MTFLGILTIRRTPALLLAVLAVAAQAQTAPMRTWRDPALHLTFTYPAELQPRDPASAATSGCGAVLLAAGMGTDPNQPGASDTAPASAHWASLTLSDMGPACIPARALKKTRMMDQMLSGLVRGPTQVLGLMPLEQPIGYGLQGRHAWMASAQGQPVSTDVVQPANGAEVLAVIAVHDNDHVLVWHLVSDQPALLNRMLLSLVDFGVGSPQPLYPGHIGQ